MTTPIVYNRKAEQIEAMQFDGTPESVTAITDWIADYVTPTKKVVHVEGEGRLYIVTMNMGMISGYAANVGDWIVKDETNSFRLMLSWQLAEKYEGV